MTPSIFGFFFAMFLVVFVVVFLRSLTTGWRMTRMMHKAFTLAEQEIDRKIAATGSTTEPATKSAHRQCAHCGSNVPDGPQCPNCGASLS